MRADAAPARSWPPANGRTAREVQYGANQGDPKSGRMFHHDAEKKGYYSHYQTDNRPGHTFYGGPARSVIPGANLGEMVGRKTQIPLLGHIVDFVNPLSDVQDAVDLIEWLTGQ